DSPANAFGLGVLVRFLVAHPFGWFRRGSESRGEIKTVPRASLPILLCLRRLVVYNLCLISRKSLRVFRFLVEGKPFSVLTVSGERQLAAKRWAPALFRKGGEPETSPGERQL